MKDNVKNTNILTTQELSIYLKLNEKTVLRLAQSGKIPGYKIGNQWRFNISAIDEYLQDNIIKTPSFNIGDTISASDIMPLSRFTDKSLISIHLKARDQEAAIREIASIAFEAGIVKTAEHLMIKLDEREKMLSTAVGKGIAIPHPRNPDDELFQNSHVVIARSTKGVDYNAPDGKPVYLFFMPCAPDVILHLKLLSKISKLLKEKNIVRKLMDVRSKSETIKLLLEYERITVAT
ncbi:MAG: PTS sugar transporter subunit IIA [Elusimicrobia bacterium]|nr:PTS sugar transporter subunit IIA [Elusimicrobiota bacterium]